jgi:hypothetical protein
MRSPRPRSLWIALALAAVALMASAGSAAAAPPIPAGGAAIQHASLEWIGDTAMQGQAFGQANFFSAGASDGTEATYEGSVPGAEVLLEGKGDAVATWGTHLEYTKEAGHHQVVRLSEGVGRVEADGSAAIEWDTSFTVNYYGSLAPFTIEDPKLTVDAAGEGELSGTLIGCTANRSTGECEAFAPVPGAQIATFSGVEVNSLGEVSIEPDYEGVEVDTTGASTAQNRTVAGWGGWPQSMVSFQIKTGLSSFFYSSGSSADAEKVPLPFTVDFTNPVAVDGATLDWAGNTVMQSAMYGFHNYFSAGVSAGDEASYKGSEGNAEVYLEGSESIATWATRESYGPGAGERQLVHLSGGTGEVEQYGGAEVHWTGAFSVNFYGGLSPFTIEDPTLLVNDEGEGELTATLSGCASSQAEPDVCSPLTPATDVQVATFSGVEINSLGEIAIDPEYEGVAVETGSSTPQNRTVAGWGAWPQSFVDFQLETGLSSYWYSSGSEDAKKPPLPFTVDFEGRELPIAGGGETPSGGGGTPGTGGGGGTDTGITTAPSTTTPAPTVTKPATVKTGKANVTLGSGGSVTVATLTCPAGGTACKTVVPKRIAAKIGGKRYVLTVSAPQKIAPGKSAAVKVNLPKGARAALAGGKLTVKIKVGVYANGQSTSHVVKVKIAGKK